MVILGLDTIVKYRRIKEFLRLSQDVDIKGRA